MEFEELMKYIEENKEEHFQDIISENELVIRKSGINVNVK
ncbi:hypothetical protein IIM_04861 [Bacillus cereus VD107]|nr:hypothetical protein IIM_04861 [Bacillus cereus VD107]